MRLCYMIHRTFSPQSKLKCYYDNSLIVYFVCLVTDRIFTTHSIKYNSRNKTSTLLSFQFTVQVPVCRPFDSKMTDDSIRDDTVYRYLGYLIINSRELIPSLFYVA